MNINGSEYKGIFYNETNEKRYYEGGAHFKYKHLYAILSQLEKNQNKTPSNSSIPKNHSSSNSMPSINNLNSLSHKKISTIKLKKDNKNLNSSLPLSKENKYKKILLPPTIKNRNNSLINNNNIAQPYSFNHKYNTSFLKNRNNSFIGISSNKLNDNNSNNNNVLIPIINHHYTNHTNEQTSISRNSRVPVSSLYCNLTNLHLNHKNNTSFNTNNMGLTLKKSERDNNSGLSRNILNGIYQKNSRKESKEEIGCALNRTDAGGKPLQSTGNYHERPGICQRPEGRQTRRFL
jgi:hypothetical protein